MYGEEFSSKILSPRLTVSFSQVAERIRPLVDSFAEAFPAVLEIPSKDHPYDPEKDSVLRRVRRLFGE
jgi:V-type H+-transporting ATPase subunit F